MCSPDHRPDTPRAGADRRLFLRATAIAGAGSALAAAAGAAPAAAAPATPERHDWRPDRNSPRFTLAVMPDTQYLFDSATINPEPLEASLRYLLHRGRDENIVFMSHLGDLTENGRPNEFAAIGEAFRLLDTNRVGYSVLAGNHDIKSSTDDQRGRTPYLDTFGPKRFRGSPTYRGATPDGYNSYHVFHAAGRDWLVLALDWRPSAKGVEWAREVIRRHPKAPVIVTTHELVYADREGDEAQFSEFGQRLWDELIRGNDQIFLTLNGHYWPAARTVRKNDDGNDVHLHITNYQNRYYGGAAMIRLYRFDLARNTIDVETISPWILGRAEKQELNELEAQEIELTGPQERFNVSIDFRRRFAGFAPVTPRQPRPASRMLLPGTLAYWRFDSGHENGSPLTGSDRIRDLSGHGNHLVTATAPGSPAGMLTWSDDHHPDQPGHGSVRMLGGKAPLRGTYFRTVADAPMNTATFRSGYTLEVFFKLPAYWESGRNAWSGLIGRRGRNGDAGSTIGDPEEPVAALNVSDAPAPQWAVLPLNREGIATNWGDELRLDTWWHLAVVNDGSHTTMYVQGCPVARNPNAKVTGIGTLGLEWLVGGFEYGGQLDQVLDGWLGDIRIVAKALPVSKFMMAD
ncbi:LamG-like jellyroll fold domain-containing protein [Wenjunlia tyrosinilytica]|nr:LamG-like jellyroll fold domain-containing protein [Wenjunlia tyrosinilytica]